jgi:general secretion pathway protein I
VKVGDGEDGFTLLEVLIAFSITSMALITLYAALGFHWRDVAEANLRETTLSLARSHLDALGAERTLSPGQTRGTYANGVAWRMVVAPLSVDAERAQAGPVPAAVTLDAADRRGRRLVHLKFYKLITLRDSEREP